MAHKADTKFWTPERVNDLRTRWKAGQTASQISEAIGAESRSAVIGKVSRMKITRAAASTPQRAPRAPASKPQDRRALAADGIQAQRRAEGPAHLYINQGAVKFSAGAVPLPDLREIGAHPFAKPWLERQFRECCWPVAGSGADMRSCCAPVERRGWCSAHLEIGTAPTGTTKALVRGLRKFA
jgi:hypothetical protein